MSEITDLIDSLAATTKKNEKIKLLEATKSNPELEALAKAVFKAAYDTSINYWIRTFPEVGTLDQLEETEDARISMNAALTSLDNLSSRNITGNNALHYATSIASFLEEDEAKLFRAIVARDLRCGATASTANKVWPGLIPDHPYMRCSSFSEKNLKNISFPCYSQTKADGLYIDIIVSTDEVIYRTRNGQTLALNNPEFDDRLKKLASGWVLMGEALITDENSPTGYCDRKTGNGILNSDDIDVSRLAFVLWDAVQYSEWSKGEDVVELPVRLDTLKAIISVVGGPLRLVDTVEVHTVEEVIEHFRSNVAKGEEGVVIKDRKGTWKDGTSKYQVKVKIEFECELKIVGYKEGTGKHAGKLGAFEMESSEGLIKVSAGGGYSDKQREEFWNKRDEMLDGICTVKSNDLIQNRNTPEKFSLFLPRFVEYRIDKSEADSFERVKEQRDSFVDTLKAIR